MVRVDDAATVGAPGAADAGRSSVTRLHVRSAFLRARTLPTPTDGRVKKEKKGSSASEVMQQQNRWGEVGLTCECETCRTLRSILTSTPGRP